MADPEQLLLERFEEAFDTTVALRFAADGRRRLDAQETDLVLEVVAHELGAGIMSELESLGGTGLEAAEVFVDTWMDRFEGFKARRVFHVMNTDAFGRTVIHGGEDGDLAVVECDGRRGIDAPHLVGTIGGDRSVMRLLRDGSGLALGASSWASRIRRSTRVLEVRTPATLRRAQNFRWPCPVNGDAAVSCRIRAVSSSSVNGIRGPRLRGSTGWFCRFRCA